MTCFRAFFFPANQASVPLLMQDRQNLHKVNSLMGMTRILGVMMGHRSARTVGDCDPGIGGDLQKRL